MRKIYLPLVVALAFFLAHCASSKPKTTPGVYVDHQKVNGRTFHKLFVEVETVDVEIRAMVEKDIVDALTTAGYAGVRSVDLIPFSLKELKMPTEEEIKQKVKESNCDGILFIAVARKGESVEYNEGTVRKGNQQLGASVLGTVLNKNYTGSEAKPMAPVNTQGTYSHYGANFVLNSNLYDVPATELMCSIQSQPIEVATIDQTSKAFASGLVDQLKTEKLLKK